MSGTITPPASHATSGEARVSERPPPGLEGARAALASPLDLSTADRAAWRELLASRPDSAPFVDEDWVTAWGQAFGPREPLLVCGWERGRLVGLGALQSLIESWAGRRTAVIQSLTNVESFRFEFLASDGRFDVQEGLWRALCEAGRWDVIRLEYLPEDSPTLHAGLQIAATLGWTCVVEDALESPWRHLPRPPASWDQDLKRKFKANLRNRERRLQGLGEVTFTVTREDCGDLGGGALEIFYTLEAKGWKGETGTAITQRPSARAFYDGLAKRTGPHIWIPILSVAGRPAAAQLIRVHGRTLFLLKTAYDPAFSPFAPGQLLTARVIRYGMDHGMEVLDFLGEDMTWKQDWEPQLRRHCCLQLFAPSTRGRYAYWTRYGLREHAKRIPGARLVVRWLRGLVRR